METVKRAKPPSDELRFRCPACGKKYSTSPKLAGQKIRCKGCGGGVRVPAVDSPSAPLPAIGDRVPGYEESTPKVAERPHRESPSPPPAAPAPRAALDRLPTLTAEPTEHLSEIFPGGPGTETDLAPVLEDPSLLEGHRKRLTEVVLSSRSEAMARVSQEVAEEEAREARRKQELSRKRNRQKKKRTSYFDPKETLQLVGWISAFVGVLAFLAWGYPEFRFPLGGLLCVMGFIVYLLGAASLRLLVAEEGQFKAIVFRFFPPYQWWFVWTRWSEAKDFALFFAAGLIIMSIGTAVIKTSPAGQRAEKSERAYQKMIRRRSSGAGATPAIPAPNPAPLAIEPK
jgi:hypothetical protein